MAPILGVVASGISGNLYTPTGSYYSIATAIGTGSSAIINFPSIPSTYSHLQLRFIGRSNYNGSLNQFEMTINGDSGNNYIPYHLLYATGSTVGTASSSTATYRVVFNDVPAATSLSNTYMPGIIDIYDYASTNKYKTVKILYGRDLNGSGQMMMGSGLWMSTSPITSLSIYVNSPGTWTSDTKFALYGIKG